MEQFFNIFFEHSSLQAVVLLALICAFGLTLGKIRFRGVSLGVTFVFFVGILLGHFGLSIDNDALGFAQDFGLALFVYALGVQVGPGFFSSLRKGGVSLSMLALLVVALGTVFTVLMPSLFGIPLPDAVGVMCGATTNTPALGAAQQTLDQLGQPTSGAALATAVTYPLGVVGVILALLLMQKILGHRGHINIAPDQPEDGTFVAAYHINNPGVFGKRIGELAEISHEQFVISRLWHDGKVIIPSSETVLNDGDRILVITNEAASAAMTILFGEQEQTDFNSDKVDWDAIDSRLISRRIVVTKPGINGKRLGALKLRNHYGVNVTRIYRSGMKLLATPDLRILLGDRITVVGEEAAIKNVEKFMGNIVADLDEPNLISIFIGLSVGLLLGLIPIALPGISAPVRLGLAGGPIIAGILMGTFGPRLHMVTYTTHSANLMMRRLGLSLYLACLGLHSGADFFTTVMRPEGVLWIVSGFALTVIPVLIVGYVALKLGRLDFATISGMLSGAMANPMALDYARDTLKSDRASVAYTTVYPLCMFSRVILAQVILLLFL
ncbi:MAG: putative transporter [Bacteroidales bacterium]|nr:putative transporter [Bacteroidales bacterium]